MNNGVDNIDKKAEDYLKPKGGQLPENVQNGCHHRSCCRYLEVLDSCLFTLYHPSSFGNGQAHGLCTALVRIRRHSHLTATEQKLAALPFSLFALFPSKAQWLSAFIQRLLYHPWRYWPCMHNLMPTTDFSFAHSLFLGYRTVSVR